MALVYAGQIARKWLCKERQNRLPIDGEVRACVRVHTCRDQFELGQALNGSLHISTIDAPMQCVQCDLDCCCLELRAICTLAQEVVQQHGVAVLAIFILA